MNDRGLNWQAISLGGIAVAVVAAGILLPTVRAQQYQESRDLAYRQGEYRGDRASRDPQDRRYGQADQQYREPQTRQYRERDRFRTQSFYYPAGAQGSAELSLEVQSPDTVRKGQPAEYLVRVTNVTDQPLAGVTVVQKISSGLEFEGAAISPGQARDQRDNQEAQEGQKRDLVDRGDQQRWNIGELRPGESRDLRVMVVPHEEGMAGVCMTALYEPAVCALFEVTSPALEVHKQAPEEIYICEPLQWRYQVRNSGTGTAYDVTLMDELPDGLLTIEGEPVVRRRIEAIEEGQSETIAVALVPQATGRFQSRAHVNSEDGEARSNIAGTAVHEADLQVQVRGPEWTYPDQPATYTVSVTNKSDVPALEAGLRVQVRGTERAADQQRTLGDLAPGQTLSGTFTIDPALDAERIEVVALAESLCARDDEGAWDRVATNIRRVPALLLESFDNKDPVQVGENTIYTIKVRNQGNAPAANVMIRAEVPPEMSVVDATGNVDAKVEGNSVVFGPINALGAGEVIALRLETKAERPGDVTMRTELNADFLARAVPDVEPTRLLPIADQRAGEQQEREQQARAQAGPPENPQPRQEPPPQQPVQPGPNEQQQQVRQEQPQQPPAQAGADDQQQQARQEQPQQQPGEETF